MTLNAKFYLKRDFRTHAARLFPVQGATNWNGAAEIGNFFT